jgi:hypothetical protein
VVLVERKDKGGVRNDVGGDGVLVVFVARYSNEDILIRLGETDDIPLPPQFEEEE